MSVPIDQMLISVEIDEGSKLEELYNMLKELQQAGGKIEVEMPEDVVEKVGRQVKAVNKRVEDFINVLKPLITKFPNMVDEVKDLADNILQELKDFIKDYNEWNANLRQDILDKLKVILNNIIEIKKQTDKPVEKDFGINLTDKMDNIIQIMVNKFSEILDSLSDIGRRITANTSYITRKGNLIIATILKSFQDLTQLQNKSNATQEIQNILNVLDSITSELTKLSENFSENANILKDSINDMLELMQNVGGQFFEIFTMVEQIKATVEGIGAKQGEMNQEINSLLEKTPNLDEAFTKILDYIDKTITPPFEDVMNQLDKIFGKCDDIWKIVILSSTRSDVLEMQQYFKSMRDEVMKEFQKFLGDYYDTTDTWKRFADKLDKIPQDRTETRKAIEEKVNNALKEFKDKLDTNLEDVINRVMAPEFAEFAESLSAIMKGETGIKLPGIVELGQPGAMENLSGFWRELLSLLIQTTAEKVQERIKRSTGTLGRFLESAGMEGRETIEKTLGIDLEEEKTIEERLLKILDAVSGYDITELITGMIPEIKEIKLEEEIPLQGINDIIKRNTLEVENLRSVFHRISTQLEYIERWDEKITQGFLDPTMKLVEDINAKLDKKSPQVIADEKDTKSVIE